MDAVNGKLRVLLVDDERFARQLYSDYLTAAGCEVEVAESAGMARALFVPGRYRLVVTDLLLPDADGLAVLADVKQRDPEVDVIVITALDKVQPAVRALRAGASDYLVKPVTPETLELSVQRCVQMRRVVQENVTLKETLALFEAGHRIAGASDREQLFASVLASLRDQTWARAAVLLTREPEGWAIARAEHVADDERDELARKLVTDVLPEHADLAAPALLGAVPGLERFRSLDGLPVATLVPLATGERSYGAAVLFTATMPTPQSLRGVDFLARSAGVALATLQRFDRAEQLAYVDDLTLLHNARYLHHVLDRELHATLATGPLALLFVDVDHFKQVNDTYGHLAGSKLLADLAKVVRSCVRDRDVPTRYGGDEFCVVLHDTDASTAMRVAERIRSTVAAHRFRVRDGVEVSVTVSIGVACTPLHANDKQSLIELADRSMYEAKRTSRNAVFIAGGLAA